ncbi:hypothetical protein [Microbacterium sp. NPDC058389]|uniref:hypothetical protein n=1 Tax=Microbacterium sp. NPDC058389 TaxID=3346475 RepID=UPI003646D943
MISWFGRGYVLRARTQPALLVALPFIAFLLYMLGEPKVAIVVPALSVLGVIAFSAEIVRGRGRRLEERLVKEWGGLPTTKMLRSSEGASAVRRRRELETFTGLTLPTEREEELDPAAADREYVAVVKVAIARIGRGTLLQSENIGYGFRRNMLAWKPVEFWIVAVAALLNGAVGLWLHFPMATYGVWAVQAVLLVCWIAFVNAAWVRDQAEAYATEFFTEVSAAVASNAKV